MTDAAEVRAADPGPRPRRWAKVWRDQVRSRAVRRVSVAARWLWCVAVTLPDDFDGRLVTDGIPLDAADLADEAGITEDEAEAALGELLEVGLVVENPDGVYRLPDYRDSQETAAAARMRRRRAVEAEERGARIEDEDRGRGRGDGSRTVREQFEGSDAAALLGHFADAYRDHHGTAPPILDADRWAAGEVLVALDGDLDRARRAVTQYLTNPPKWNAQNERFALRDLPLSLESVCRSMDGRDARDHDYLNDKYPDVARAMMESQ